MNHIGKSPIQSIGYGFVDPAFLEEGRDEYQIRFRQNPRDGYRILKAHEIEALVRNHNTSDDWNRVLVSDAFDPGLVRNCKFFGLVRIGRLEPWYREFHNLRMPVGLYNSTIISCDFGDNIVVDNVNYLSHCIIGDDAMVVNVNELSTTGTAKFGNGILKQGEAESSRIWVEVCNENGGRSILPFEGMLPGDAYLWARFRDDEVMMNKFKEFTERSFDTRRGYYGEVGARTVIKNCKIIKDVRIGSDAYLKGANKIKNVTVNSSTEAKSQVGEGCELVNGIIGFGCRVFYGVKAVRFVMASHSQLKYGARLINSYLGDNATISCCEVLNSLIFPFHEQHHNNSFLCASMVMGQSNMAAGATLGSNHNSRANDGELVAGRGFWPGLCVSLKHNSRFATFNIVAKGDYEHELDIPFPFSLVSQNTHKNQLQVMPAYWLMYNLYGLCRNEWKYGMRDKRRDRRQHVETSFLAPDSVNEMMDALPKLEEYTGRAYLEASGRGSRDDAQACREEGKRLLASDDPVVDELEIHAVGVENSRRKTVLLKTRRAYGHYVRMIYLYGAEGLLAILAENEITDLSTLVKSVPWDAKREAWHNVGGQLIPASKLQELRGILRGGKARGWEDVHEFYENESGLYATMRNRHAVACLLELGLLDHEGFSVEAVEHFALEAVESNRWLMKGILSSRRKDFENGFRKRFYESDREMEKVLGRPEDNAFVRERRRLNEETEAISRDLLKRLGLKTRMDLPNPPPFSEPKTPGTH